MPARASRRIKRHTRANTAILEGSVAPVQIVEIRFGIIRDDEVWPPVGIEVVDDDSERLPRVIPQPDSTGHVGESGLPFVPVKNTGITRVDFRSSIGLRRSVQCMKQISLRRPLNVIADEQIQVTVPVVIQPGGSHRPGICPAQRVTIHTQLLRNVPEHTIVVSKKHVVADSRHVDVGISISVIVTECRAHAVDADVRTRFMTDIPKRPVAEIPVQRRAGGFLSRP